MALLVLVLSAILGLGGAPAGPGQSKVFSRRSPGRVRTNEDARRMQLARRLRVARGRTGEGALLTRSICGLMRRLIARSLGADELARLRAELRSDGARRPDVRVGAAYLGSEGLVTTAPRVLFHLPALPPRGRRR